MAGGSPTDSAPTLRLEDPVEWHHRMAFLNALPNVTGLHTQGVLPVKEGIPGRLRFSITRGVSLKVEQPMGYLSGKKARDLELASRVTAGSFTHCSRGESRMTKDIFRLKDPKRYEGMDGKSSLPKLKVRPL